MNRIKNLSLLFAVLLMLYGLLEAMALLLFFCFLPPLANPLLDDGVPILLQHSKAHITPQHYIALAGDSYAMGLGDEYYRVAGRARARYGSAPLIHQKTGKDVISFGSAGNGSIAGLVTEPISTLTYFSAGWRTHLDDPEQLLLYFYEGNDLNDNVEYLQHASKKRKMFDYTHLHDSLYFQDYIQEVALEQDSLYQQAKNLHVYNQFYLGKFIMHASAALAVQLPRLLNTAATPATSLVTRSPLNPPGRFEWTEPGTFNRALIHAAETQLPDTLQGPSMDLTTEEKEIALISFREALHFLKQKLPTTKMTIVYLPSVISCYDMTSPSVSLQSHARRKQFIFDTMLVNQQSNWMAKEILRISSEEHVAFIDTRPAIREAAKSHVLHGPLDWNHFNEAGYQVLAETVVTAIGTLPSPSP